MARDRISEYVGPGPTIVRDVDDPVALKRWYEQIKRYDNGLYVADIKEDGHWAEAKTNSEGTIYSLRSRTGLPFEAGDTQGILGLKTHLPDCTLAGELECGTQAANKRFAKLGHRRFHVFDAMTLLGQSIVDITLIVRRGLLKTALIRDDIGEYLQARLPLIDQTERNFVDFYLEAKSLPEPWKPEGIVIKRRDSKYKSINSDGKVDFWIRSKDENTVDYYVMGIGQTPSRADNLDCGLWDGKKVYHVLHVPVPKGYKAKDLVGKVIECKGWEIMDSGALRSAQFKRVRNDKTKEMCTL